MSERPNQVALNRILTVVAAAVLLTLPLAAAQQATGSISGHKFRDDDNDGTWDPNEPAVAGWTIFLDTNNDGDLDEGEPRDDTDAQGVYEFTGLAPGSYVVREVQRAGWIQTAPTETRFSSQSEVQSQGTLDLIRPSPRDPATFVGRGGVSIDAVGTTSVGTVQAEVPNGSTVVRAYLHVATRSAQPASIPVDDTPVTLTWLTNVGSGCCSFRTGMADVTALVSAKVGSGGATYDFAINEGATGAAGSIEGSTLVVIYSNPNLPERTVAILQGGLSGPEEQVNVIGLGAAIDPAAPGFLAQMSLAIQFGFQAGANAGQYSRVDINDARLTTSAGGQDDGFSSNGGLITAGGLGDSPANPADPNALSNGFRYDDELYDLAPFLRVGDTGIRVETSNPSNDDSIFLMIFILSGQAAIAQEPGTHRVTLEGGQAVTGKDFGNLRISRDDDGDGRENGDDNCPSVPNPAQADQDRDGQGDACDADVDGDGVSDAFDNCPSASNPSQANADGDGTGDACDPSPNDGPGSDPDLDGVPNERDNCDNAANADQSDRDGDGAGDVCDPDDDNDGRLDGADNCPSHSNADQANGDGDPLGDACDPDPRDGPTGDRDADAAPNNRDNCVDRFNPSQGDSDGDGVGDVCDDRNDGPAADNDHDGRPNSSDNCPENVNGGQQDADNDTIGDACDPENNDGPTGDKDKDGFSNTQETSSQSNPDDNRSTPPDIDGDGIPNASDNCPSSANLDQSDGDQDGQGDACDLGVPTITVDNVETGPFTANLTVRTSSGPRGVLLIEYGPSLGNLLEQYRFNGPGPHTLRLAGLDAGRSYEFRLSAADHPRGRVASTTGTFRTTAVETLKFFAANVQAQTLPNGSVYVSWSLPFEAPGASGATGFLVWRSSSPFALVGRINDPEQRSFLDVSASLGKVYRYTVTFFTGVGPDAGNVETLDSLPEFPGDENVPAARPAVAGGAFAVGGGTEGGGAASVLLAAALIGFLMIVGAIIVRKRRASEADEVVLVQPTAQPAKVRPARGEASAVPEAA